MNHPRISHQSRNHADLESFSVGFSISDNKSSFMYEAPK
jgi:hypothetical protein